MPWCYWWCCWHQMMLILMPLTLHEQKGCVPHFDHLDLTNAMVLHIILLPSCDSNTSSIDITWLKKLWLGAHFTAIVVTNVVTLPKRSCCTTIWASWPNECCGTISNAVGIMSQWHQCQWHHMTKQGHITPYFDHCDLTNAMDSFMAPLVSCDANPVPMASHDQKSFYQSFKLSWTNECSSAIYDTISIMWWKFQHQWNHMTKKSHVALHYYCLELINGIMTVIMPLALCDANACTEWITRPKKVMLHIISVIFTKQMQWLHWWCLQHQQHMKLRLLPMVSNDQKFQITSHFEYLDLTNIMISLMMALGSCETDTSPNGFTCPKKPWCTLFQSSWPNECNGAFCNAIGITWSWCLCQQCKITDIIILYFILITLT